MTEQDEARELLRRYRAAEDELACLRYEMDEAAADGNGHIDAARAAGFAARLESVTERKRQIALALHNIDE